MPRWSIPSSSSTYDPSNVKQPMEARLENAAQNLSGSVKRGDRGGSAQNQRSAKHQTPCMSDLLPFTAKPKLPTWKYNAETCQPNRPIISSRPWNAGPRKKLRHHPGKAAIHHRLPQAVSLEPPRQATRQPNFKPRHWNCHFFPPWYRRFEAFTSQPYLPASSLVPVGGRLCKRPYPVASDWIP
jgi:hypothetical protein